MAITNRNTSVPFANSRPQVPLWNMLTFRCLEWQPACPYYVKRVKHVLCDERRSPEYRTRGGEIAYSRRRRSTRRAGSAAPVAERRRLSERVGRFAAGCAACGASRILRPDSDGFKLRARHDVGRRRSGPAVESRSTG